MKKLGCACSCGAVQSLSTHRFSGQLMQFACRLSLPDLTASLQNPVNANHSQPQLFSRLLLTLSRPMR